MNPAQQLAHSLGLAVENKTGNNRNPSATKSGPGRFHKHGYQKPKARK